MSYSARVLRILIASPSDVEEEREAVVSVIQAWNDLHSRTRELVLLPLRWETHTAPEFGTRPQDVINRAIVDDCDLVVGIFWTRLGSPSGEADSGTVEEIERASKAGKPIMLYFSRTEINPHDIDMGQMNRLKLFEERVRHNSLVERYKTKNQFRDKFSQQLEIKIKEIERLNYFRSNQFEISFIDCDGTYKEEMEYTCIYYDVIDLVDNHDKKEISHIINQFVRFHQTVPIAVLLENIGNAGVRNIFAELNYNSTSETTILLTQRATIDESYSSEWRNTIFHHNYDALLENALGLEKIQTVNKRRYIPKTDKSFSKISYGFEASIANLSRKELKTIDKHNWRIPFELEGLQPQRAKLIQPVVYASCFHNTVMHISAKIFANSFAEPISVEAVANIEVDRREVTVAELISNWRSISRFQLSHFPTRTLWVSECP